MRQTRSRTFHRLQLRPQSGTGVLTDDAIGKYASEIIYSDLDIPLIESLPLTQLHREIDVAITEAGKEG